MLPTAAVSVSDFLVLLLVAYGLILALTLWLITRTGRDLRPGEVPLEPEQMRPHLFWGIYYCNPSDPRAWVSGVPRSTDPARNKGRSINMRHRSWAVAVNVMLVIGVALIVMVMTATPTVR